jgi:hypothetical protein
LTRSPADAPDADGIGSLNPEAKFVVQAKANCCGIRVARKFWVYVDGYPPPNSSSALKAKAPKAAARSRLLEFCGLECADRAFNSQ